MNKTCIVVLATLISAIGISTGSPLLSVIPAEELKEKQAYVILLKDVQAPWNSGGLHAAEKLALDGLDDDAVRSLNESLKQHVPRVDVDDVRKWITKTGASRYSTREMASDWLHKHAYSARSTIRDVATNTEDPEIRERLDIVLRQFEQASSLEKPRTGNTHEISSALQGLDSLGRAGADLSSCGQCASDALFVGNRKTTHLACQVLGQMGEAAAPAVPSLTELIISGNALQRRTAICVIAKIGPKAKAAESTLLLVKPPAGEQEWIELMVALGRIGNRRYLPRILKLLEGNDQKEQAKACKAIVGYRAETIEQLPTLIKLAKSRNIPPSSSAIKAIVSVGEPGLRAVLEELRRERNNFRMKQTLNAFPKDDLFYKIAGDFLKKEDHTPHP